jgi:outer membrane protein OmpA-like peptidoglycan-associated protein
VVAAGVAATLVLAVSAARAQAPAATLVPPAARITDRAIQADHRTYEAVQGRIQALNDRGRPVRDYPLAKAQCWLDVSFHEYTRNDRSAFPQAALDEAVKLIGAMEAGTPTGFDTPLVKGAPRLRPDLWERATALRAHGGFRCAQQKVACAEVELVHAGNEHAQQQWRHAKPYVQIAEDLLDEARGLAERCEPPPPPPVARVVPPAPLPPPAPPAPPVVRETFVFATSVVFSFDRHEAAHIRAFSRAQLESVLARVAREGLVVEAVQLTGHADRLNRTGEADYNLRLSERRAATVRELLVARGIPAASITTAASGDTVPVEACGGAFRSEAERQECLLPNRRVEVSITARRR